MRPFTKTLSEKRLTRILEDVCNKAVAYKNEHKLGVYKKARLGKTFRWELVEAHGRGTPVVLGAGTECQSQDRVLFQCWW